VGDVGGAPGAPGWGAGVKGDGGGGGASRGFGVGIDEHGGCGWVWGCRACGTWVVPRGPLSAPQESMRTTQAGGRRGRSGLVLTSMGGVLERREEQTTGHPSG
jgi:hypothetical protein